MFTQPAISTKLDLKLVSFSLVLSPSLALFLYIYIYTTYAYVYIYINLSNLFLMQPLALSLNGFIFFDEHYVYVIKYCFKTYFLVISKYIICLQNSYSTNLYLLGTFLPYSLPSLSLCIRYISWFTNVWASVIISLVGEKQMELLYQRVWAFLKTLDIYCQVALWKGCVNLFFLQNSIFHFREDDRAIIGGQIRTRPYRTAPASVCALDHISCRQGNRRWMPCPRA